MTYTLIGVSAVVLLLGPVSGLLPDQGTGVRPGDAQEAWFARWGVLPRELWSGSARPLLTPLTALFLHANWLHLAGNALFLLVFGGMLEERLGRVRFLLFHLAVGYAAMVVYAAFHAGSERALVGASGAVSGVLGAFLALFPRARVTSVLPFLLFVPLRFPAWLTLPFWLALQWAATRHDDDGPGVAHLAHVAGFTLGFLYAWLRWRGATVGGPAPASKGEPAP